MCVALHGRGGFGSGARRRMMFIKFQLMYEKGMENCLEESKWARDEEL